MTAFWRPAGDREIRIGLAGLGSMGRNHLRVITSRPGARLVAIADPMPEALAAAVSQTGAAGFAEPLAMLAEAELDAVVIAAPTTAHRAIALDAIGRGIAVLVEKPLASTVEEALEIVAASRATGVPVQVGHVERFNPAVRELGRLLHEERWLSTVYAITSRRAGPFPARIRDVGVTVDLATHDVDICSWIAGERPIRVHAETAQRIHADHEDLLYGLLHFPSGVVAQLDVDWLTPAKRRQLTVVGEEGMFELDYLTQRLTFTQATDTTNPRLIGGYAPTFEGDVAELTVPAVEPLALEHDAFLTVVREGGRPEVDAEDGLWAVGIAIALLDAAAGREVVELDGFAARFAPAAS
ncbi:MAG TPA: Gfo/Idh/MocA family oxidoreductase [Candidatus Limnocylindrales bacterium]|nr:Gfo/Idh/MocA family oxidoreductase [Candidatus Limnocylindrales bacterium]